MRKDEFPIVDKMLEDSYEKGRADAFEEINKWDFYDQTREKSTCVIMSTETAIYANIIIKKSVIK